MSRYLLSSLYTNLHIFEMQFTWYGYSERFVTLIPPTIFGDKLNEVSDGSIVVSWATVWLIPKTFEQLQDYTYINVFKKFKKTVEMFTKIKAE